VRWWRRCGGRARAGADAAPELDALLLEVLGVFEVFEHPVRSAASARTTAAVAAAAARPRSAAWEEDNVPFELGEHVRVEVEDQIEVWKGLEAAATRAQLDDPLGAG
jgi:hypothetical protein